MPATVRVSESTRTSLRAIIVIAALVVLLVPVAISVAHGASRLNYGKLEVSEPLPAAVDDLQFVLETSASVVVKTADTTEPTAVLTGTGPRDDSPSFEVRNNGTSSVVTVDDQNNFENTRLEVTLPEQTSKDMTLDFDGGYGTVNITGDYQELMANTDGGSIDISGSADRVQTSTDWGATTLHGTFGSIESKTDVGTLDGSNLSVRDHVDAVTSTGTIDLDFSNDMVPESGIVAKTDEGTIDLRLPRLDLAQKNMAAEATAAKDDTDDSDDAKEFFYRINASSTEGSVDLAKDLKKYDAAKDAKDAEGKRVIPISASAETGAISIEQN